MFTCSYLYISICMTLPVLQLSSKIDFKFTSFPVGFLVSYLHNLDSTRLQTLDELDRWVDTLVTHG